MPVNMARGHAMIATQTAGFVIDNVSGDVRVQFRSNRSAALAALTVAVALCGCANVDFDTSQSWFAKPLDVAGHTSGYSFSELQEAKLRQHPVTASDLVDASGACPPPAAPQQQPAPGNQAAAPALAPDTQSLLGGGVALGMSECDVVFRAGLPSSVQLGKNPNGDRTAVLSYNGGPRPGVYHFERGTLMQMDRVEVAVAPQPAKKNPAKPAKTAKSPKKNDQS
jgi:hypothetical protein